MWKAIKNFFENLFKPSVDELPEPCKKVFEPDGTGVYIDNTKQAASTYVSKAKKVEGATTEAPKRKRYHKKKKTSENVSK